MNCWFSNMMKIFEKCNKYLVVVTAEEWRECICENWKECGFVDEKAFFKEYARNYNLQAIYNEKSDVMILINEDKWS